MADDALAKLTLVRGAACAARGGRRCLGSETRAAGAARRAASAPLRLAARAAGVALPPALAVRAAARVRGLLCATSSLTLSLACRLAG